MVVVIISDDTTTNDILIALGIIIIFAILIWILGCYFDTCVKSRCCEFITDKCCVCVDFVYPEPLPESTSTIPVQPVQSEQDHESPVVVEIS